MATEIIEQMLFINNPVFRKTVRSIFSKLLPSLSRPSPITLKVQTLREEIWDRPPFGLWNLVLTKKVTFGDFQFEDEQECKIGGNRRA